MTLPVYLRSDMAGAPVLTGSNGSINALLSACLVNGFNTQAVTSATASGGVVTFNFPSAPGFSALDTVTIAGATNAVFNGQFRAQSAANNQVLVPIPGAPDGAVAGTITMKFSPLGWTRPYSGTGLGAYRQGGSAAHKRFLRVYDGALTSSAQAAFRGYEAMTAISTGTGPFPTTAQAAGNGVVIFSPYGGTAGPFPWALVGTPRAFYLTTVYDTAPSQNTFRKTDSVYTVPFGELANIRKPGDIYAQYAPSGGDFPQSGVYIARPYTGVSGSVSGGSVLGPSGTNSLSGTGAYPDVASGGIDFVGGPAVLDPSNAQQAVRGYLPGVVCPLQRPVANGPAKVGDILSNISGITGRVLLCGNVSSSVSELCLLLDEDWGDA